MSDWQPEVIDRAGWGASAPKNDTTSTAHSHALIFHHSVTSGAADPAATLRAIQRQHIQVNGSNDIEYNLAIDTAGRLYLLRGWFGRNAANGISDGRRPDLTNLATKSCVLLGCYSDGVRGLDRTELTIETKRTMQFVARAHLFIFAEVRVFGHRDIVATACPGDEPYAFVQAGLHIPEGDTPPPPPPPPSDMETLLSQLRELRQGDTGLQVRNLQALLNVRGAGLNVDGNYGPTTTKAIDKFLRDRNIINLDGSVMDHAESEVWKLLLTREDG